MKSALIIPLVLITLIIIAITVFLTLRSPHSIEQGIKPADNMLKITSPAFTQDSVIPQKYTCKGENVNPPILIEGVPENAKSLVLIVDDPDAPGGTFTHWILLNINPKTTEIKENSVPSGATSGINDFRNVEYQGPCPPSGTHRYFFTVYALDTTFAFTEVPDRQATDKLIENHIITQGQLMAKFSK